ncbi:hypothetical protein J1605_019100 [Eschrichtius robustus]|uniref:Uncharacterized protein n=1 Tax=Eschrichtius robustus TaxID=9764 RepID=A0AB34HPI7_ESCRO|nr:hypothetical protein J1605_019100 [Eschrichtius robustus]
MQRHLIFRNTLERSVCRWLWSFSLDESRKRSPGELGDCGIGFVSVLCFVVLSFTCSPIAVDMITYTLMAFFKKEENSRQLCQSLFTRGEGKGRRLPDSPAACVKAFDHEETLLWFPARNPGSRRARIYAFYNFSPGRSGQRCASSPRRDLRTWSRATPRRAGTGAGPGRGGAWPGSGGGAPDPRPLGRPAAGSDPAHPGPESQVRQHASCRGYN